MNKWTVMLERGERKTPLLYYHDGKVGALRRANSLAHLHDAPEPVISNKHQTIKIDASEYYATRG